MEGLGGGERENDESIMCLRLTKDEKSKERDGIYWWWYYCKFTVDNIAYLCIISSCGNILGMSAGSDPFKSEWIRFRVLFSFFFFKVGPRALHPTFYFILAEFGAGYLDNCSGIRIT